MSNPLLFKLLHCSNDTINSCFGAAKPFFDVHHVGHVQACTLFSQNDFLIGILCSTSADGIQTYKSKESSNLVNVLLQ